MKKTLLLYFGDVFWCTTPYEGVEIFNELSKEYNVIPVFGSGDIRIHKTWRGDEKFWFDKSIFQSLPYEEANGQSELLDIYNKTNSELLLMSSHMQFKSHLAQRNRFLKRNGVKICLWDIGGGDGLYCDSPTAGWDFFLAKGDMWKEIMKDSEKFPKFCGAKMKENPENIFVTGSPSFDHLVTPSNRFIFCEKYNLDHSLPIVAYLPGNPRPDSKYSKSMNELHEGLLKLQKLNHQICFKTHPGDYISTESINEYHGVHPRARMGGYAGPRYTLDPFNRFELIDAQDGFDLYKVCDFAITNLSHVGFELGLINKPIVSYNMKDYPGWHMCDNLCETIYTDVSSTSELVDVCLKQKFIKSHNNTRLNEFFFFPKEGASTHILCAINKILHREQK